MSDLDLIGWGRLRHGGLLLDAERLRGIAEHAPGPLSAFQERELRRRAGLILDDNDDVAGFVAFVLEDVCGFSEANGSWDRGNRVSAEWKCVAVTGESIKPRHLWHGTDGGVLPVFLDSEKRVGVGRGRRATSHVLQWLRASGQRLALLTNSRQWRLVFAGLDFDAWCEWDVDLWFEEGETSSQVTALRTLLSPKLWTPPAPNTPAPLLQAILDSRKGQAELSAVLGERVREAVEILVQAHGPVLNERCADVPPGEIYRAAVRVVMRMVVVMFAESRELLRCDNALYHGCYGLSGLLEALETVAARGGGQLARLWAAWPRVLALFRLVYGGSHHPELPVPEYGGDLFSPGDAEGRDGMTRALGIFESVCFEREVMSDRDVLRCLERITRTRAKIRQGRTQTWVTVPVGFSDLSSEYIGILYEGLLDFELRTAPEGDPVIFLAVGNQPALPLSRLEAMDDKALANLLEKVQDTTSGGEEDEEEAEADEFVEDEASEAEAAPEDGEEAGEEEEEIAEEEDALDEDERLTTRTRAEAWARRAVDVGKLAGKPRGRLTPEKRLKYEEAVARKARQLVTRVVLPGEWHLVRWGGTRKGSGTFYTRPGLAVPTVQRTLRPLAWNPPEGDDGKPDPDAPVAEWTPKKPEEILALKVCDPACGSGTFPVGALRFLTDALYISLHHHGRISVDGDRSVIQLVSGNGNGEERLSEELLPCRPDDDLFEQQLRAVLRRHVVERCIYGVDVDPLAVELCRLSLWIETMDRTLPFSFLDHKIRPGNSLVGAWFDQFQHYPAMAWKNRDGGDKGHTNGVHFEKEARTKAINAFVKDKLTLDLRRYLEGPTMFDTGDPLEAARTVHDDALAVLSRLHELPVQDTADRARIYREELLGSEAYRSLKAAMDLWCACWFWPGDELDHAPLPATFHAPSEETRATAERLAQEERFFHWELEFPDVFRAKDAGFDAVLGNPPWDIAKPNSKEFFSNHDPLYRSYGKQEAVRSQTDYFAADAVERDWLDYNTGFRALSNFVKYAANAYGDPETGETSSDRFAISRGNANAALHARWRHARAGGLGFADAGHPFRHQGSADLNLYKLFLEQAHALLQPGGRLGFIVPSGLYSDQGTGGLRELFVEHCRWEWLFGFENREGIFGIHRSFKFSPVVIEKGGKTDAIRTAFMRRRLEEWERAEDLVTPYTREQVERFSPRSRALLEIQSARDLKVLEKIYANSVLLGDDGPEGWGVTYATEFHMTNDSKLFPPRPKWEEWGYRPDEYSRWIKGPWRPIEELFAELSIKPLPDGERRCARPPYDRLPVARADIPPGIILSREADAWIREQDIPEVTFTDASGKTLKITEGRGKKKRELEVEGPAIALPLYEGRMIGLLDFSDKGWVSGKGRSAVWDPISWDGKHVVPQFLMATRVPRESTAFARWSFMDVSSSTNRRTFITSLLPPHPAGNKTPILASNGPASARASLAGIASSLSFDWSVRCRMTGTTLNWFIVEELPVLEARQDLSQVASLVARLNCPHPIFSPTVLALSSAADFSSLWPGALTRHERTRLRAMLEAIASVLFGISTDDFAWIVRDCDHPSDAIGSLDLDPKGFWRVDKDKPPEHRLPVLALVAVHDLQQRIAGRDGDVTEGIEAFLAQNDGEGWMLPESLRLADYGLGRDERATEHQPVRECFGPRFLDWQLAQSAEESWRECHLHARNLLGEDGYRRLREEDGVATRTKRAAGARERASGATDAYVQGLLFE